MTFDTAVDHTKKTSETIGCEHVLPIHHGVVDVECTTAVTGLAIEVVKEMTDVPIVVGEKAGTTKAYPHCLPLAKHPIVAPLEIAKKTVAPDCIKEIGVPGEFPHPDTSVVPKDKDTETTGGCHGTGLKDI